MSEKVGKSPASEVAVSLDDASAKVCISEIKKNIADQQKRIGILRIELKGRRAARISLERAAVELLWKRLKPAEAP